MPGGATVGGARSAVRAALSWWRWRGGLGFAWSDQEESWAAGGDGGSADRRLDSGPEAARDAGGHHGGVWDGVWAHARFGRDGQRSGARSSSAGVQQLSRRRRDQGRRDARGDG